jgi:hypothetical protein
VAGLTPRLRGHAAAAWKRRQVALRGNGNLDLAFIVALPDLERGGSGRELTAGVTLMEEKSGTFFSTPEPSTCWADIADQQPLEDNTADPGTRYRIDGSLYCVSPLAEVNGNRNVTLTNVRFTGQLNWQVPE